MMAKLVSDSLQKVEGGENDGRFLSIYYEYNSLEELCADPGNTVLTFDDGSILVVGGWNAD